MKKSARSLAIAALLAAAMAHHAAALAAQCAKQSPAHAVALVELYTSEGCDSCPPADRWLSQLRQPGGGESVVALSLHVDYWDRLGWPDRFASRRFTERQQMLSRDGGTSFVYTPGVFLNLRELRGWRSPSGFHAALKQINARPAGADIRIELDRASPGNLLVKADFKTGSEASAGRAQAFVALYENRLSTDVRAGENRGATLRHDYVVREWFGPLEVGGATQFKKAIVLERAWKAKDLGVAAFVQAGSELLQATALDVCTEG